MSGDRIRYSLLKAHDENRLVTCKFPGGGNLSISLEKHMVEQSMRSWKDEIPPAERQRTLSSVMRAIKRVTKRLKKDIATQRERDELAADIALWLGHELMFSDGERHLVKGVARSELTRPDLYAGQPPSKHEFGS